MPKVFPYEVHERFLELVCAGVARQVAGAAVGVSDETGARWWRESGVVGVTMRKGSRGGLLGTAPGPVPGGNRPGDRSRRRRPLTAEDRAVIAAGVRQRLTLGQIGVLIGRDKSVVCRELARNRGRDGSYYGPVAHRAAHERRRRPKPFKLAVNPALCRRVEQWMDDGWSPRLIATVLGRDAPDPGLASASMDRVSHETIYQALYVQGRGQLRRDLYRQLSLKRPARRPRGAGDGRGRRYSHALTIRERPAEAADRAVPGHWEGDLILGAGSRSAIGTLVERQTRFTILLHLPGRHDADSVAQAMIREMGVLPEHLRRSLTWDRGVEMTEYERIRLALQMPVYFCDPRSPWQRGTNENTNRLLRFWFEKGSDLSVHSADDLRRVAATLNARPRPTLNLQTPAQALAQLLANPQAA